jgi:hypothetical protein
MRKAIGFATITLNTRQYEVEGVTHIDIEQVPNTGFAGTKESRILFWRERDHKDTIFGEVTGKSRWVKLSGIEEGFGKEEIEFLGEGWLEGPEDEHVQSYVVNEKAGWTANQASSMPTPWPPRGDAADPRALRAALGLPGD